MIGVRLSFLCWYLSSMRSAVQAGTGTGVRNPAPIGLHPTAASGEAARSIHRLRRNQVMFAPPGIPVGATEASGVPFERENPYLPDVSVPPRKSLEANW